MTSQVTQCPKCQTSFRVTEAQLNIANGAVRCGSCLHIFHAADHLPASKVTAPEPLAAAMILEEPTIDVGPEPAPDQEEYAEPSPEPSQQATTDALNNTDEQNTLDNIFDDSLFADDFDVLDDDLAEQRSAEDEVEVEVEDEDEDDKLIYGTSTHSALSHNLDHNEDTDNDTLFGAEDLDLEDDSPGNSSIDGIGFSDSFLDLDNLNTSSPPVYSDLDNLNDDDSNTNEDDWANKLLEENPSTTENNTPEPEYPDIFDQPEDPVDSPLDPELLNIISEQEQTTALTTADEDIFILGADPMIAGDRIGEDKLALLANIEPEPVRISSTNTRSKWIQRAWHSSIAAAILLLAAQYVTFNFDRLARDESYRPLLAASCKILDCQLPTLGDVDLIRSSNLMIRSHPTAQRALVVDTIITNRANFQQRFPTLELQFTDLSGKAIAGRRFSPGEYLSGELLGSKMMPSKQPIHISLEIVDPGEQAINYQLNFYSQEEG